MKKFFAAMVLAGLVAAPLTFAQETKDTTKKEKKAKKAKTPKAKKTTEEKK